MANQTSNDNEHAGVERIGAEPLGQAALLIVESLLHNLVERKIIGAEDAVEIIGVAVDVATELMGDLPPRSRSSLTILETIHASLSRDLP